MKQKVLALCLLNVVSVLCTTPAADQADARKTAVRSAAVGATGQLNSLQSSQDTGTKSPAQAVTNGQTTYRVTTPEYSSISQPQNAYYAQPSTATGGYFLTLNSQGVPSAALSPGPTPVIMQYLPHNAQQGPIQYLQLIPTRPLIVPISPYIPNGYNSPYSAVTGPSPQAPSSPSYASSLAYAAGPSYAASPSYGPSASYGPSPSYGPNPSYSLPHHSYSSPPSASPHTYSSYPPSASSPVGGYSTNYLTYFRPSHGMQLINSPIDLSLNTDEYIPMRDENAYKMRRV